MNWANTMASKADDAANHRILGDEGSETNVGGGTWDPHQVWLTRVKQPRDIRRHSPDPSPLKSS